MLQEKNEKMQYSCYILWIISYICTKIQKKKHK